MAKCKRVLRCYRCGSILQKDDPNEKGYISPESFERPKPIQILYCDHCFEIMKSFNNDSVINQTDNAILKMLDDAVASDAIILWVIDLFNFNGTLNEDLAKKVKKLRVVVMANKFDTLPGRVDKKNLEKYIEEKFNAYGIKPYSIKIIGNPEKTDFSALLNELEACRMGHDVYMVGNRYAGKTTLINKTLRVYKNKTKREIRSFKLENSDSTVLEIPLSRSSFLYELPGISQDSNVFNMVEKDVQKIINPKKGAKSVSKSLMVGQTLMVGSLASFGLISGKTTSVKFYCADGVETKVVSTKHVDNVFQENILKKNIRPVSERYTSFVNFDLFDYTLDKDGQLHDISIDGIGWISLKAMGQTIRVSAPKGAAINEGLSKIR